MVQTTEKIRSFFLDGRRPLIWIVLVGLFLRLLLAPLFTYSYDIYHWAMIMQNIDSGNNLYELTGYFYTPVWGYIVGFFGCIWNSILSIDVFGERITDLIPVEMFRYDYISATITTPAFNFAFKMPLIICDLVVGYLIYHLVKEFSNDTKKATFAFALWFLCPIVIYMSGVQAMFDTFSALFVILFFYLFWKEYYVLGGITLAFSVLLKFFPLFTVFVILGLIYIRHKGTNHFKINLAKTIVGGVAGILVIMLPNIINGTILDSLTFLTDRASGSEGLLVSIVHLLMGVFCIVVMYYFSKKMFVDGKKDDLKLFLICVMFTLTGAILINPSPQYGIAMLPLLIILIAMYERKYFVCWLFIGIGATLLSISLCSFSLLSSMSAFLGWVSAETIINLMNAMFTVPIFEIAVVVSNAIQILGLFLIFLFYFEKPISVKFPWAGNIIRKFMKIGNGGDTVEN